MCTEAGASPFFTPLDISSLFNREIGLLSEKDCDPKILEVKASIPSGFNVMRGIPFLFGSRDKGGKNIFLLRNESVFFTPCMPLENCKYLVFAHSADLKNSEAGDDGIISPMMGCPRLGEVACVYKLGYDDGTCARVEIKRRFNINEYYVSWGEGAFEAVPCEKPRAIPADTGDSIKREMPGISWGWSQTRVAPVDTCSRYALWLYSMENPCPGKNIVSICFIPVGGTVLISGITACSLTSNPLRWESRKKVAIKLPESEKNACQGDYGNMEIDLGQIISVNPMPAYENSSWESGYNNEQPKTLENTVVVEYTAHPGAWVSLGGHGNVRVPVSELQEKNVHVNGFSFCRIPEAVKRVTLKVKDRESGHTVPVKIHIHGASGEYLPPVNRHRIPNRFWFEDYSTDFVHGGHLCTYIDGEAEYKLPLGDVYVEVSKGFEIKPVRRVFHIDENTDEITIELEHILPWRKNGWVTADTHVHFLSPHTALLEGEAEGVNVVNLLASQWGELFTNIGDFDGRTTPGSKENGGNGEFLVRVGTENRQHILGHISLLGYEGGMILPLTTGGPEESALGDPVEETLCGWAKRCRDQNGVVILPHFPKPRAEGAAAIVAGLVDGVEMTSWGNLYNGISPYSLSDWYRYLNCGYHVPAVGGTDKMSADTAVGTVRTYAKIEEKPFCYESWKDAVKGGYTFVTYGPLLEFTVEGIRMGGRVEIPKTGATLHVEWKVASVTVPVTKIELVVNGRTCEVSCVDPQKGEYSGSWPVRVGHSSWIALRIRGRHPGKAEVITAHSSAVMAVIPGESCLDLADAYTILEQIEGTMAYIETIATKAEVKTYKRLMMTLAAAHRTLHNRLHQWGMYHHHTVAHEHHREK